MSWNLTAVIPATAFTAALFLAAWILCSTFLVAVLLWLAIDRLRPGAALIAVGSQQLLLLRPATSPIWRTSAGWPDDAPCRAPPDTFLPLSRTARRETLSNDIPAKPPLRPRSACDL